VARRRGRFISTETPDLFSDIFHQMPVLDGLGTDGDRFAWAEIYSEAATTRDGRRCPVTPEWRTGRP